MLQLFAGISHTVNHLVCSATVCVCSFDSSVVVHTGCLSPDWHCFARYRANQVDGVLEPVLSCHPQCVFCNDGVRGVAPALALPWGHCIIQEGDPHRVLELSEISCVLAQDGLRTLLETSHPLVVTVICNVSLSQTRKNKRQDWIEGKSYVRRQLLSMNSYILA